MLMNKIFTILIFVAVIFSGTLQAQKKYIVKVSSSGFLPSNLIVATGDTVEWRWIEGNHTVTSDSTQGIDVWDASLNSTIRSFSKVIETKGIHRYYCRLHQTNHSSGVIEALNTEDILPAISYFNATLTGRNILVKWKSGGEGSGIVYNIERRTDGGPWEKLAIVNGPGISTRNSSGFTFTDKNITASTQYTYRLKAVSPSGNTIYSGESMVSVVGPESYNLYTNFPNPFNPATSIKYSIPERSFVSLKVYNALGLEIATLVNSEQEAGEYEVRFDGTPYPSGIYYYQLKSRDYSEVRKMTLLK